MKQPTIKIAAAVAALLVGAIGTAPGAQSAAVVTGSPLTCNTAAYINTTSVVADPGDAFSLNFQGPNCSTTTLTFDAVLTTSILSGANIGADGTTLTFLVDPTAAGGSYDMTIQTTGQAAKTIGVTVTGASGGTTASDNEVGPPSWHKSYQRANKEEACQSGWNPSYAAWANSNSGGWVCVQELYYSGGTWLTR